MHRGWCWAGEERWGEYAQVMKGLGSYAAEFVSISQWGATEGS